jgi:hypothetical protein
VAVDDSDSIGSGYRAEYGPELQRISGNEPILREKACYRSHLPGNQSPAISNEALPAHAQAARPENEDKTCTSTYSPLHETGALAKVPNLGFANEKRKAR